MEPDGRVVHLLLEARGGEYQVACGITFKRTSKTDAQTGWWDRVTCPKCQQRYAHIPECAAFYNSKPEEPAWLEEEEIEW